MRYSLKTRYITTGITPYQANLFIAGIAGFVVATLIGLVFPAVAPPVVAILLIGACITMLIGYKYSQGPELSFTLTFMHLQFHSHCGGWLARWKNIDTISQASIAKDGWHQPIPWVGVKLKDYEEFIKAICPRVATKLLIDQRILLIMAHKGIDNPHFEIEDIMFDDNHYITQSGNVLKGLQAMLANRMRYNRELIGYDFFISEDFLDRPAADFAGLARRYLAAS
ncbi:DUF2982 domain-containing protein [Photobacterium sp. DNB22_13_2]